MEKRKCNPPLKQSIIQTILFYCLILILQVSALKSQTYPSGFSQVKVATIYYPTAMAFAPDGRIFCTEKAGKVKIIKNGAVLGTPFLQVSVDQQGEHGLAGIALDPNFSSNNYVYVYYTTSGSIKGRLSRFTANGDLAVTGSEVILLETDQLSNSIHCGGGIAFGPDGKLYIGIGNDNINSNSQNIHTIKGKVLRINKDGSAAAGNPFSGSEAASRVWALGLRNPWTVAAGSGKIFVNDVGEFSWEEINDCTTGGKNFGWPSTEGYHNNPAYSNPVYAYPHGQGNSNAGCSITGGQFFNSSASNYPSQYLGKYFYIDYCGGWINYLDLSSGVVKHNFASNLPSACNYIKAGNDGNLYYFSISQNALYKIIYSGSNNSAPVITSQPNSITVPAGQSASFNVSASGSTPLSYQWQKNGQNIAGANAAYYLITNVQNSDAGSYRAVVSNAFGSVTSNAASLTVSGFNTKPVATILTPTAGSLYRGGDVISFSGTGTDVEDGNLPASAFKWIVSFYHDQHFHPGPYIQPGITNGTFSISPDGEKSANVWYRIYLVVTDNQGATDTAKFDLHPKKSTITLLTQPGGLQLLFNDQPVTTNYSVEVVSGMLHSIGVVTPQNFNDSVYTFTQWVHGGNATQVFPAADINKTYTAVFKNSNVLVSVNEITNDQSTITVYPNPGTGSFIFDICSGSSGELMSVKVFNSAGQLVYNKPPVIVNGCKNEIVELSDTSPGIYILQIKLGTKTKTARLILNSNR